MSLFDKEKEGNTGEPMQAMTGNALPAKPSKPQKASKATPTADIVARNLRSMAKAGMNVKSVQIGTELLAEMKDVSKIEGVSILPAQGKQGIYFDIAANAKKAKLVTGTATSGETKKLSVR